MWMNICLELDRFSYSIGNLPVMTMRSSKIELHYFCMFTFCTVLFGLLVCWAGIISISILFFFTKEFAKRSRVFFFSFCFDDYQA